MKRITSIKRVTAGWTAVLLAAVVTATTVQAAAPALQGQVTLRPLTPQDIKDYSLTGTQGASGLTTVGVGQPAYLEVLVNNAVTNSDITNVSWVLTAKPVGSAAALAVSPLGTNVPTYKMADRFNNSGAAVYKVPQVAGNPGPTLAGRTLLVPDVTGLYTVTVTVQTASSGSTNLSQNITASTYMGVQTCELCHSGGNLAPDKYEDWSKTAHATFFTRAIDGLESDHYGKNGISCHTVGYDANTNAVNNTGPLCWQRAWHTVGYDANTNAEPGCDAEQIRIRPWHTVGYDANTNAVNGGFDDVAKNLGWIFPAGLTNGNWATSAPAIKNLANIQCENCHGAGSEHAYGELIAPQSPAAKAAIAVSFDAGNCAQCHDSKNNHFRNAEWNNSKHAVATRTPSSTSAGREACARCHTGGGFVNYTSTLGTTNIYTTNNASRVYTAITCATCHDPHDAKNPHQLRAGHDLTLGDGTLVTNAGAGGFCMNCHQSRTGSLTNSLVKFPLQQPTYTGGSSSFGPHDNPAADMLEGVNGYTYGKFIPSAAHASAVTNTCVGCHMQPVASTDPGFTKAGGHTMKMSYAAISGGVTNTVHMVGVCVKCHGELDSFDMVRQDYDGDGIIDGVQTEVTHLLDKLNTLLPSSTYVAGGGYVADGVVGSFTVRSNWPAKFLQAAWNWQFVNNDLSKGVHNAPYAVGLLQASIADLTDDADHDGLSDKWERENFGSITAYDGNGDADQDGVSNALEYSARTNPKAKDSDGDGVNDLAEFNAGSDPLNALDLPGFVVKIYTAAEVEFASETGKKYQVQTVSDITGTWLNVGSVTNGTGNNISMVTSTRSGDGQGYFRVVQVP